MVGLALAEVVAGIKRRVIHAMRDAVGTRKVGYYLVVSTDRREVACDGEGCARRDWREDEGRCLLG